MLFSIILMIGWLFLGIHPAGAEPGEDACAACHLGPAAESDVREKWPEPECRGCHLHTAGEENRILSIAASSAASTPKKKTTSPPKDMVFIPGGPFIMGSNGRLPDEGPEHKVTLGPYYLDRHEVTNEQYRSFAEAAGRPLPPHWMNGTYPEGKARHPVTYVSWYDAEAYCRWAGKRLPTEEEWEKGARGPDGRIFPWGNDFDKEKANVPALGIGDTTPVGRFEKGKSFYGLHDMSGNVWEWTSSWYKAYPGNTHPTENYGEQYKVLKGGSWFDCSFYKCGISAPTYNRGFFIPETQNSSFGFRCAKDP
jgi:formylglycine-generating enzyme required for sulfatase activity